MVTVNQIERTANDFESWVEAQRPPWPSDGRALVERAFRLALPDDASEAPEPFEDGVAVAHIVSDLGLTPDLISIPLIRAASLSRHWDQKRLVKEFGARTAKLVKDVSRLEGLGNLLPAEHMAPTGPQVEGLRKLLLSVAEDGRVILITLADRLQRLRKLDSLPEAERGAIARETLNIHAPLANRLGIGQLKWELEDLAFRALEPERYRRLAKQLEERRVDRERYVERVVRVLQGHLARECLQAEVHGRAKHIYSIWKKMRRKQVEFEGIYDVRAVRVLVESIPACYAALGVVHAIWKPIHVEFDDYIANPKGNGYQSLHTAVIGPRGRTIEVQIRTREMHDNAELGVAAHWLYKEGGRWKSDPYEQKISWLRHLLEVRDQDEGDLLDRFRAEAFEDRVYVITPRGDILDLPWGATPLDFAFKLHSELGHRCRGAKVDGRIVPLNHELRSGERVELLTSRHGGPSRDWLNVNLGYLRTARARSKVRQWFRQADQINNTAAGRTVVEQEFARLGLKRVDLTKVAKRLKYETVDEMLAAVGFGDVTVIQVVNAARAHLATASERRSFPVPARRTTSKRDTGGVQVRGVGNLLTQMSGCCKPIPPEPIVGYITQGRGVSIHRKDCRNLLNMQTRNPDRIIEVAWGGPEDQVYPVDVTIEAYDRTGLLRDVTTVLAAEHVNVIVMNTFSDAPSSTARLNLTLEITELGQLHRVLDKLSNLPNVSRAARRH